jgi:hypothetical protein
MTRPDDGASYPEDCPRCGCCSVEWVECWAGCDRGQLEAYEEDPLWYAPGETKTCSECHGKGGRLVCAGRCDENGKHDRDSVGGAA